MTKTVRALNLRKDIKASCTCLWRFPHSAAMFKATMCHDRKAGREGRLGQRVLERFISTLVYIKLTSVHTGTVEKKNLAQSKREI